MESEKDIHKGKTPLSDCEQEEEEEEEEEIVLFIGSIGLKKDGIFLDNKIPNKSQGNNGSSNSSGVFLYNGSSKSQANKVPQIENLKESNSDSKRISSIEKLDINDPAFYDWPMYEWVFDDQETFQTNPVRAHYSLFNIGSSSGQSRTSSFHEYPSIYDLESPYEYNISTHTLNWPNNFVDYNNFDLNLGDEYNAMTTYELKRRNELWEASLIAQAQENSKFMREVMSLFEKADYNQRQSMISAIQGSVSWIMVDEQLHSLFFKVVDLCEEDQLSLIVEEILSREDLFISAAFCRTGSTSIVKLIRKLKKTDYAFAITRILASRFYELTTHHTARIVIQHCLNLFGNGPNQVLNEQAILLFKHVAVTAAGCRSLNDCIDTISGSLRTKLLLHIASASDFLSHDPYGNYVVQHVLELRDETINAMIFSRLQGQFVLLAQKKGGSHVVQKCLESGSLGTLYVVEDIVQCKGAPILLARDQFGNYVIQTALKETKIRGFTDLYISLVDALERYYKELKCAKGGRQVISLIEDEIFDRRQSKFNGKGAK